jgi:DNA-binding Lrp family transcriptional regulator
MKGEQEQGMDPKASVIRRIRVRSEDSAFVYAIFEASEGVSAYSTLPNRPGDRHRDLELVIPVGQLPEAERIIKDLIAQFPGEIYELEIESR